MHEPVLLEAVIQYLNVREGGIYVDCTLGTGGHTKVIAEKAKKVYGIDRDLESLEVAKANLEGKKVEFLWTNFRNVDKIIKEKVDGVLFDLGISSYQLDSPERGFSYRFEGPLDLRMDRKRGVPCYKLLKEMKVDDLEYILKHYGEERYSHRIARMIVNERPETTSQLKKIVKEAIPWGGKTRILARVWQSLRIYVNDELNCLRDGLEAGVKLLKVGGRICVISYHSLEDRIVKHYFKGEPLLRVLTKKPIYPSESEISRNPRSRSAKLRCAEKVR